MAGNPLASLPGLPQRPSLARSAASETRLTQPGIEVVRSRKLNPAPTAAFRIIDRPLLFQLERLIPSRFYVSQRRPCLIHGRAAAGLAVEFCQHGAKFVAALIETKLS